MNIAVLPGDGIGPEVVTQAVRVRKALERHGVRLGPQEAAGQIERTVRTALAQGFRTADIAEPGARLVGTEEMGAAVAAAI